jgi:N-acetylmuramoyl-L-alanine amidase
VCYPAVETYRKDRVHPPGYGYGRQLRDGVWTAARAGAPTSIIIHATHGKPGTKSTAEAIYLQNSDAVSAQYLVGRDGLLYRILPDDVMAWHAGRVIAGFQNERSIGIELHADETEPILEIQRALLFSLCRALIAQYKITKALINTHRAVAIPKGRKSDPASWPQVDFEAWRERLYAPA